MKRGVVEKTPKTEMDNKRIFTTSHMTVPALKISDDGTNGQLQVQIYSGFNIEK